MKFIISEEGKTYIQEKLDEYPSLKRYYDEVASRLKCKIEDIVLLEPNDEEDEEGWKIPSFFKGYKSIVVERTLYHEYSTNEFAIGLVLKGRADMKPFIAECNASPFIVYMNYNDIKEDL